MRNKKLGLRKMIGDAKKKKRFTVIVMWAEIRILTRDKKTSIDRGKQVTGCCFLSFAMDY